MSGPLSDLRVIDLTSGPAGGLATMVLADFGADVIKVEQPGGDPYRTLPNAPLWLRGKRSVVLDLPADGPRLHDLVRGADVAVASFPPGRAKAVRADPETLRAINPRLVFCSITGWGPRGPYSGYPVNEGLVAAKSGRMSSFRGLVPREGPAYSAVQVATHACAQAALQGIIAALLVRTSTGRGELVQTSLLQGLLPYDTGGLIRMQLAERYPEEGGRPAVDDSAGRMPTLNYHPVMAGDGRWIQLGNLLEHLFVSFLAAAGLTEFLTDERYRGQPATWPPEVREAARDRILQRMREKTAAQWMAVFRENGNVAAEPFATTEQALTNPELVLNGDVVETGHPRLGHVRWPGPLARLTATPGAISRPDPLLGQHTAEVLAEPRRHLQEPSAVRPAPQHPLEGVMVLEFATIIAAPLAASLLGDLGARVIKVEPIGGDSIRGSGSVTGPGAVKYNASKESICVDLKTAAGQEIARRLLAKADVIILNYRPGVPERLGIGYEVARSLNSRVVYLSANGYGPDAPGASRPCAHPVPGAAIGGALHQAGAGMPPTRCDSVSEMREAARRLMRANEVNPDPSTSMVIASAALLGLYAARRGGIGQQVFVNMLAANLYANHDDAIAYQGKQARPAVDSQVFGLNALYRLYPAREGWVFLGLETSADWQRFCLRAGLTGLGADPRFASLEARAANDERLVAALGDTFRERTADEWEALLAPAGVGCVRADAVTPGSFWQDDPHVAANGFAVAAEHVSYGDYKRHGPVVTFAETAVRCGPGCVAGQHTDSILTELGYQPDAIASLRERRIVSTESV